MYGPLSCGRERLVRVGVFRIAPDDRWNDDLGLAEQSGFPVANLLIFEAHVSVTRELFMGRFASLCLIVLVTMAMDARFEAGAQQPAPTRNPSAAKARIYFIDLKDGATIPSKVKIRFGIENMEIAPAGIIKPNTGHHHLLIDTRITAARSADPKRLQPHSFWRWPDRGGDHAARRRAHFAAPVG